MQSQTRDNVTIYQLYEWYPVPGGCPLCKEPLTIGASQDQRLGKRNLQVINCPHCMEGLECHITRQFEKDPKDDLKQLDGQFMSCKKAEGTVIPMASLASQAGEA